MGSDTKISRRIYLQNGFVFSAAIGLFWLESCSAKPEKKAETKIPDTKSLDDCQDFSMVTDKDLEARKKLGYLEKSPIAESKCGNCQLWLPPKEGSNCGNCQLFKGPVLTAGYCTYWAPQKVEEEV